MFCAHTLITSSWCNLSLFPTTDPLLSPVSVSPACLSINFPFSQLTRLLPVSKHTPQQGSVDSHKKLPIRKLTLSILLHILKRVNVIRVGTATQNPLSFNLCETPRDPTFVPDLTDSRTSCSLVSGSG